MGLDMYLSAETYVSGYSFREEEDRKMYAALVEQFDAGKFVDPETPSATVSFTVAYWRKANQIHQWFVQNVQGGEDKCRPHAVSREQLRDLRELCRLVLGVRTKVGVNVGAADKFAGEKLPPQKGFFFGGADVDQWYWQKLEDTVEQLDRVLAMPEEWSFEYHSSW